MNSQHRKSVFRDPREAHKLPGPCISYLLPGRAGSSALQIPWRPPLAGSLEVWGGPKINIFCPFFCVPPGLSEKTLHVPVHTATVPAKGLDGKSSH